MAAVTTKLVTGTQCESPFVLQAAVRGGGSSVIAQMSRHSEQAPPAAWSAEDAGAERWRPCRRRRDVAWPLGDRGGVGDQATDGMPAATRREARH